MKLLIVIHLNVLVFRVSSGVTKSFRYELSSINEINGNVISSFKESSVQKCVALCDIMYGCLSVYFHNETQHCNISDYYPLDNIKSGIPSNGWTIFFRRNFGINPLVGGKPWQSSTYVARNGKRLNAAKALDGRYSNIVNDCAHTHSLFSYWAVEFGTASPVKSVKIKSRSDCCYTDQKKFTVTVANNRNDITNDAGKFCGSYLGPAINKAPYSVTINCERTIFGKFLKIQHGLASYMAICEVYVYTP